MQHVYIAGYGINCAIGTDRHSVLAGLRLCRTGIGPMRHLHSTRTELPVGEVHASDTDLAAELGVDLQEGASRCSLLGAKALREALAHAGIGDVSDVALVSGTTVGGMDKSELHYRDFFTPRSQPQYIRWHDCGSTTDLIARSAGSFGMVSTISTACSSAANAFILGARLIQAGMAGTVVAGGAESLTRYHLNGFNSLMILDSEPCRPFDAGRRGLNLGEGAAYVVLMGEEELRRRGLRPLARLSGWGNACDAYHQTASSPDGEGAFAAMRQALRRAGLQPSDIGYVNAHGTGTPNNDASESAALRRLFGEQMPPVSSTKAYTGHTTSASGSIEAVICLLALEAGIIPPNLHYSTPDPECIIPATELALSAMRHAMCNSFGFGGNDTSLVFSLL